MATLPPDTHATDMERQTSHSQRHLHPISHASPPPQRRWRTMPKSSSMEVLSSAEHEDEDSSTSNESTPKIQRKSRPSTVNFLRFHSHQPPRTCASEEDLRLHPYCSKKRSESLFHSQKRKRMWNHHHPLHHPKNSETLTEILRVQSIDVNEKDEFGDAPLHFIVRHKRAKRLDLLVTLLSYSQANVNLPAAHNNTALHFAVAEGDEMLVKVLLGFGADINALTSAKKTALDIALDKRHFTLIDLLVSLGGNRGEIAMKQRFKVLPRLKSFHDSVEVARDLDAIQNGVDETDAAVDGVEESRDRVSSNQSCQSLKLKDFEEGKTEFTLYEQLKCCINKRLEVSGSFSCNPDEAIAITMQQRELVKHRKTAELPKAFETRGGSRILCLDGGGIRGLIQIEVLRQLEEQTERRITELFDWIIGTSTGGIIALAMVYKKRTLRELRQLYFKIKDKVFGSDRAGFAYNTRALEEILIEEFGTDMTMSHETFPRVLISAVNKKTTQPELHFFNNCFGNEYSNDLVWKVARYTSAAPMFFSEMDNYVDGGVLANNPCEFGLTAIHNHYRLKREAIDIALVVSIGTGTYPPKELGNTDAQEFLFFGKHWFKSGDTLKKRAQNLLKLLTTALLESESVSENCKSRCAEQGIAYYRFSPQLEEMITAGETSSEKLANMLMQVRLQTIGPVMEELIQLFHLVAELTRKLRARKQCETRAAKFFVH